MNWLGSLLVTSFALSFAHISCADEMFQTLDGDTKSRWQRSLDPALLDDEALVHCYNNLIMADSDGNSQVSMEEYKDFINLHSGCHLNVAEFRFLPFNFVVVFFAEACLTCYHTTQHDDCCVGDSAYIDISPERDLDLFRERMEFTCSSVDTFMEDVVPISTPSMCAHAPSQQPSSMPSARAGAVPGTLSPTQRPTSEPSPQPSASPTVAPTAPPTNSPSAAPSTIPSLRPTATPSSSPSMNPSAEPSPRPTLRPTRRPTLPPSSEPTTDVPTVAPSDAPSVAPTESPVLTLTRAPTESPVIPVTRAPTESPVTVATRPPTESPVTSSPTENPAVPITRAPTASPVAVTMAPTKSPVAMPVAPTENPTTKAPTESPVLATSAPTESPVLAMTRAPTESPVIATKEPTTPPTRSPTAEPTSTSQSAPDRATTPSPSDVPSNRPSEQQGQGQQKIDGFPTDDPAASPSLVPTAAPVVRGSVANVNDPVEEGESALKEEETGGGDSGSNFGRIGMLALVVGGLGILLAAGTRQVLVSRNKRRQPDVCRALPSTSTAGLWASGSMPSQSSMRRTRRNKNNHVSFNLAPGEGDYYSDEDSSGSSSEESDEVVDGNRVPDPRDDYYMRSIRTLGNAMGSQRSYYSVDE